MRVCAVGFFLLIAAAASALSQDSKANMWAPVCFHVREWAGTSTGEPRDGTASHRYEFVLENRFILGCQFFHPAEDCSFRRSTILGTSPVPRLPSRNSSLLSGDRKPRSSTDMSDPLTLPARWRSGFLRVLLE